MRVVAPLLALVLLLLSGCISVQERHSGSNVTCVNGVCSDSGRSYECDDGECEVCVGGECVECEREDCKACYEDASMCPAGLHQAPAANQTFPDVNDQRTIDLTQGMPRTTWAIDSAAGSSGHIRFVLRDLVTKEFVLVGGVCFEYSVTSSGPGSWSQQQGSSGCGNTVSASLSSARTLADWNVSKRAHYDLAVSAGPQANELVVDIVIDNP